MKNKLIKIVLAIFVGCYSQYSVSNAQNFRFNSEVSRQANRAIMEPTSDANWTRLKQNPTICPTSQGANIFNDGKTCQLEN
jgi:hypothetical protein